MKQNSQPSFSFLLPRRKVVATLDRTEITSDAGLLPLKEFDHKIRYLDTLNAAVADPRQPAKVIHEQRTQLAQRLYGIVAGYPDCNDHERLRHDPAFKVFADLSDLDSPLAGQSSLCRLENRFTADDFHGLLEVLVDSYRHTCRTTRSVILDLDTTADICHGEQQLCLFNAHYKNYIYLPLLIFEAHTGHLLSARLRTGCKPKGEELVSDHVRPVVEGLRAQNPGLRLRLRGDAEFAAPDLYDYLEAARVEYAISITGWKPFREKTRTARQKAERAYAQQQTPQRCFGAFTYRVRSWERKRRLVFKVEVSAQGTSVRFLITNLRCAPQTVFAFYEKRGDCENRIKELKNHLAADRLSCHQFMPNAFRLLLHSLAYNLVNLFRLPLRSTELAKAQIDTIRTQLFKVGAVIESSTRRIWFRLSRSWPGADLFQTVCSIISRLPSLTAT